MTVCFEVLHLLFWIVLFLYVLAFVLPEILELKWFCFVRHSIQIVTISSTLLSVAVLADFWIFHISLFQEFHIRNTIYDWFLSLEEKNFICRYMLFCVNFILLEQGGGGRCCFQLLYLEPWEECWGDSEVPGIAVVPSFLQVPTALQWKGLKILFYSSWKEGSAGALVPLLSVMVYLPICGYFLSYNYWED